MFSSLFLFISFLLLLPSLYSLPEDLSSCLTLNQITNFSMFPTKETDDSTTYYNLLYLSVQNLRFADPNIPKPLAIFLPESAEQLGKTITCCREGNLEIRARCGGHSYEGTSVAVSDGNPFVVIDLMNLNKVSINVQDDTAVVEGGATLGETYSAIAEASSTYGFSAGSCPTVGVGGHIGGGGFGLLSRKYGLAADNVVDAILVTADGSFLDRKAMGEDVFWAIRGGGGGIWGIVYSWKIKLLKVPEIVTGFVVFRAGTKGDIANLVNKWQYIAPNLQNDFYLSCFIGAGLSDSKTPGVSTKFNGFYLGSKTQAVSILNNVFPELGIVEDECKEMSWIESILFFSGLGNGSSISDLKNRNSSDKHYFKAKLDYVRTEISLPGIEGAIEILEKEPKGYVILDPYGGIMNDISSDEIAFPHRKGNIFSIQYLVDWNQTDNNKSDEYMKWIREFYTFMTPYVSWGPRAAYVNYMDFDLGVMSKIKTKVDPSGDNAVETARDWGEKYFLKNFDRLVTAKTFIDPENFFSNQQGIPPMPPNAMF
ncbi:berberine bridge enzyme-like D-2 [Euphorbia lathyris]|uniref:berberine bridge enzyme-like D-2 n=1 Tax=Euphorbia lathyris TaxID=212925 RepID=UPI003313B4BD